MSDNDRQLVLGVFICCACFFIVAKNIDIEASESFIIITFFPTVLIFIAGIAAQQIWEKNLIGGFIMTASIVWFLSVLNALILKGDALFETFALSMPIQNVSMVIGLGCLLLGFFELSKHMKEDSILKES